MLILSYCRTALWCIQHEILLLLTCALDVRPYEDALSRQETVSDVCDRYWFADLARYLGQMVARLASVVQRQSVEVLRRQIRLQTTSSMINTPV